MSGAMPDPETAEPDTWLTGGPQAAQSAWPAPQMLVRPLRQHDPVRTPAGPGGRTARDAGPTARPPRRPVTALAGTIAFGLLAAFFAWQSAEPVWLALGRGETGTATVARCDAVTGAVLPRGSTAGTTPGTAASYRCVTFTASGRPSIADVTLLGAHLDDGERVPARMVTAGHGRAYAVSTAGLHLRWSLGLGMVALCGAGVAWATGARRTRDRHQRRRAVLLSYAGPALLVAGFLAAAW
jgi:hypothetical protein